MKCMIPLLVILLSVSGCAGGPKPSLDQITPICTAMIGPIHYNSTVPKSKRFAGAQLAPDLKQRNQVGRYLGCRGW